MYSICNIIQLIHHIVDAKWNEAAALRSARSASMTPPQRQAFSAIAAGRVTRATVLEQEDAIQLGFQLSDVEINLDSQVQIYTNRGPSVSGDRTDISVLTF